MVNVNKHEIFPTMVYQFNCGFDDLNASMVQFNCLPCTGYIFPAWLQHWVPPTPVDRVSISWNILVRGQYGETEAFQNANI